MNAQPHPQRQRRKLPADLRSQRWFAPDDLRSFGHRSRLRQMGYSAEEAEGRPVIAILNSWSDLSQCHTHFPERVAEVMADGSYAALSKKYFNEDVRCK